MTKIKIVKVESNVPIPVRREVVPLNDLGVGQSFLFPIEDRSKVQTQASKLKAKTGKKFTVRKVDSNQCRVWREE